MANSLAELNAVETPPLFKVGFDLLEGMFQFTSATPDMLPAGTQITITGPPGTGKTRLALQLANAIGKNNLDLKIECRSYEMSGPMLKDLVTKLDTEHIDGYLYGEDLKEFTPFVPGTLYVIDSLDYWAAKEGEPYPSTAMAKLLEAAKAQHISIIIVHHKAKTGRAETGVVLFRQYNDIRIEVKLNKNNKHNLQVSTDEKNRYPGPNRSVTLRHSASGLIPVPPTPLQQFWTRISSFAG